MKVLQILPRVPPAVCGIGDYSWNLARQLRDEHDIHCSFLAAGTGRGVLAGEAEFPVFRLSELTTAALVEFLAARRQDFDVVVLHLSVYGYQKRGVPLWLSSAWCRLSQMKGAPRLITMFHELYASGPVSSSAFWLQPLQKRVLRDVALASDSLRTNRQPYADWLRNLPGLKDPEVVVMPVYSNFGEPLELPLWEDREPAMALFSWGIHSGESLETVLLKAADCGRRFGIQRLHLIGGKELTVSVPPGIELVRHGFMAATALSALLSSCRMAYSAYSPEHFGKSTLMAAFAAHGLVVITQGKTPVLPDGLQAGVNVLNESSLGGAPGVDPQHLAAISSAVHQWYQQHSLSENARSYAAQIRAARV
jgi:hypothetical protein